MKIFQSLPLDLRPGPVRGPIASTLRTLAALALFSMMLSGCPFLPGWGEYSYEPHRPQIGRQDQAGNEVLSIDESRISIVSSDTKATVYLPIRSEREIAAAEIEAWVWMHDTNSLLDQAARTVHLRQGLTVVTVPLMSLESQDRTRLRLGYSVTAQPEPDGAAPPPLSGTVSVNESLAQLRLQVYAPDAITSGDTALVRVMATFNGRTVSDFDATVDLLAGETVLAAAAESSPLGIATASLDIPGSLTGEGDLKVHVETASGLQREVTIPVTVTKKGALLLTPDKPRYQPGQTMHLRVMAVRRPDMTPLAGEDVLLEIKDGKGYKVFKKTVSTNAFGISRADFTLASEVNMGTYEIRAALGDRDTVERVIVEHYALPRFDVSLSLDRSYVLPMQPLSGSVDVRYTFGEPVSGAVLSLVLAYADDTMIAALASSTDENGRCGFSMDVGKLDLTDAVKLTVEATDPAGQQATKEFAVAAGMEGIGIWMVPAHDRIEGQPWTIFLVARDPSGRPVRASGEVVLGPERIPVETSGLGIAEAALPAGALPPAISVSLQTEDGLFGSADFDVKERDFPYGIALRSDRARYAAGEEAELAIEAPASLGEVLVEASVRGLVVFSDTVPLDETGEASLRLPLTPDMDGVTLIEAFGIDGEGEVLQGRTALYVFSPKKLTISAALDKDVYLPGETATLNMSVMDGDGRGVPSALGLVIVDEAVYALQSFNPTTYSRFFAEAAVSKNAAHVMDREDAELLLEDRGEVSGEQESASRALLAANAFELGADDTALRDLDREQEMYWATFVINSNLYAVANYMSDLGRYKDFGPADLRQEAADMAPETADPWGRPYAIEINDMTYYQVEVVLVSSGPDESMGTEDDITASMPAWI
jgi:hypothetical protein